MCQWNSIKILASLLQSIGYSIAAVACLEFCGFVWEHIKLLVFRRMLAIEANVSGDCKTFKQTPPRVVEMQGASDEDRIFVMDSPNAVDLTSDSVISVNNLTVFELLSLYKQRCMQLHLLSTQCLEKELQQERMRIVRREVLELEKAISGLTHSRRRIVRIACMQSDVPDTIPEYVAIKNEIERELTWLIRMFHFVSYQEICSKMNKLRLQIERFEDVMFKCKTKTRVVEMQIDNVPETEIVYFKYVKSGVRRVFQFREVQGSDWMRIEGMLDVPGNILKLYHHFKSLRVQDHQTIPMNELQQLDFWTNSKYFNLQLITRKINMEKSIIYANVDYAWSIPIDNPQIVGSMVLGNKKQIDNKLLHDIQLLLSKFISVNKIGSSLAGALIAKQQSGVVARNLEKDIYVVCVERMPNTNVRISYSKSKTLPRDWSPIRFELDKDGLPIVEKSTILHGITNIMAWLFNDRIVKSQSLDCLHHNQ